MYNATAHQQNQIKVINSLEEQVKNNAVAFTIVAPIDDFEKDSRMCLTCVHIPDKAFILKVQNDIIEPLRKLNPSFYFYPSDSFHLTIKNIRISSSPPSFTNTDILKAEKVLESVIPRHKPFKVYFYRLLLFPNNLALVGTTDPELDSIFFDLDNRLKEAGIADDKTYMNSRYYFSNMTLARFNKPPSENFIQIVEELSQSISFEPYTIDSVTLLSCSPVFTNRNIVKSFSFRPES